MAAYYTFEDLSGSTPNGIKTDNPYHDLIESCNNDASQIQTSYATHRKARNKQQKDKLLAADFTGVTIDQILHKLEHPEKYPDYQDPRSCLVFWARPTTAVKQLIGEVQRRLKQVVPNLWIMPQDSLHMTALEITHSLTTPETESLVEQMLPQAERITEYTLQHRARLVKPVVSFDAQALAMSWLPAAGEVGRSGAEGDAYTYHHLRRDLFGLAGETGVKVASRYVIPSAHLTIGRFIEAGDLEGEDGSVDRGKVAELVRVIEGINAWLEEDFWPKDGNIKEGGEWIVGQEKGLEFRKGALWYGSGGERVRLGTGF